MRYQAWFPWAALTVALLLAGGCIELTGQRITLHYDQAQDRLSFLIHYDGIYNSKEHDQPSAEERLRAFVRDGDVMLFDWFGHVECQQVEEAIADADTPPALRAFAEQALHSAEVVTLGHYRDADDRIGATQMVIFHRVSQVIAAANAAINEAILDWTEPAEDAWEENLLRRWKPFAANQHVWVALEGHSLVLRAPMHRGEWARAKLTFLVEACKDAAKQPGDTSQGAFWQRLLAAAPLSITHSGDQVELRVGNIDTATVLRCQWRHDYRPNVEETVQEVAPVRLDRLMAESLLGDRPRSSYMDSILAWGPPEERVRAVLGELAGADDRMLGRALRWLEDFAASWNGEYRYPVAPSVGGDPEAGARAWRQWYRTLLAQPEL